MEDHDPGKAAERCRRWFGGRACRITSLPGGSSGSPVFAIDVDAVGPASVRLCDSVAPHPSPCQPRFVLKAFALGWSPERARWLHRLINWLEEEQITVVAGPERLVGSGEQTILEEADGRLWEMVAWRGGSPLAAPRETQAARAMEELARVHRAAARFCDPFPAAAASGSPAAAASGSPGIPAFLRRQAAARRLLDAPQGGWGTRPPGWLGEEVARRREVAAAVWNRKRAVLQRLVAATPPRVRLQPVLRDVWSDHVLFEGDAVSGLIDLHAAGIDTPATDLARLLGSWRHNGAVGEPLGRCWADAIAAYESVSPLEPAERRLIDLLDAGGVIGGLEQWFRWILEEKIEFSSPVAALKRIDVLLEKLDFALDRTSRWLSDTD